MKLVPAVNKANQLAPVWKSVEVDWCYIASTTFTSIT